MFLSNSLKNTLNTVYDCFIGWTKLVKLEVLFNWYFLVQSKNKNCPSEGISALNPRLNGIDFVGKNSKSNLYC